MKKAPPEEELELYYSNPIHFLFANILERAIRDLNDPEYRRQTVFWFTSWINGLPGYVSYKDIRDNIELTPARLVKIRKVVKEASLNYNRRRVLRKLSPKLFI